MRLPGVAIELPVDTRTGEVIQPVVAPLSKIKRTGLVATIHEIRKLRQITDAGKRIVVCALVPVVGPAARATAAVRRMRAVAYACVRLYVCRMPRCYGSSPLYYGLLSCTLSLSLCYRLWRLPLTP
jgi:hypothetical protein